MEAGNAIDRGGKVVRRGTRTDDVDGINLG